MYRGVLSLVIFIYMTMDPEKLARIRRRTGLKYADRAASGTGENKHHDFAPLRLIELARMDYCEFVFIRLFALRSESSLVEKAQNLSSGLLPAGLLVSHDAVCGGQDDVAELARGKEVHDPLLQIFISNVKAGADDAALVQTSSKLDNDLARPVVIDDFEFPNVACSYQIVKRNGIKQMG